eukprot:COSAG01_NODE_27891_length_674_cov_1.080000_1_plen_100_part_01
MGVASLAADLGLAQSLQSWLASLGGHGGCERYLQNLEAMGYTSVYDVVEAWCVASRGVHAHKGRSYACASVCGGVGGGTGSTRRSLLYSRHALHRQANLR